MAQVQTTYDIYHDTLTAGQVATTSTRDVDSGILHGDDNVPFGYAVRRDPAGGGEQDCVLGAGRRQIAMTASAINSSAQTLPVDGVFGGELSAGINILVGSEILFVSAVAAGSLTVTRGALDTTAASITNNTPVYAVDDPLVWGIACLDQRLPAANDGIYTPGDPVSVLVRGDIAVPVSAAVSIGDAAVVTTTAAAGDPAGSLSARAPSPRHVPIPGAVFVTSAADDGLAVVRLGG